MATKHTQCRLCGAKAQAMGAHYVGHHPLTDEVKSEIAEYARSHRTLRLPVLCRRFGRGHDAIRAILIEAGVRLPGMKRAPFRHLATITLAEPVAPPASPPPAAGVEVHTSPAMNAFTPETFVEAFMEKMLQLERRNKNLEQEVINLRDYLSAAEKLLGEQKPPPAGNWQNKLAQVAATLGMPNKRDSQ
jgi:hypothetical protein